jgi:hypothetical protein
MKSAAISCHFVFGHRIRRILFSGLKCPSIFGRLEDTAQDLLQPRRLVPGTEFFFCPQQAYTDL